MKPNEKDLWIKVQESLQRGNSYKISENERSIAKKLVDSEKCFWSIDYDHLQAYEEDHSILTTGNV